MKENFSGKDIIRAGEYLASVGGGTDESREYEDAMAALSYWRGEHISALNVVEKLVREIAEKSHHKPIIAKRLKRTPSIIRKLQRGGGNLKNMQDIVGCRVVVPTVKKVQKIVRDLKDQTNIRELQNYIETPKDDGYRSVHLLAEFDASSGPKRKVEIQVRTALQHSWATAIEIVDLFTGQAIKANEGSPDWATFFRAAGNQFAFFDSLHESHKRLDRVIKELQHSKTQKEGEFFESAKHLHYLTHKLDVIRRFELFSEALDAAEKKGILISPTGGFTLLKVLFPLKLVESTHFSDEDFSRAKVAYLEAEKAAARDKNLVVALVSASGVSNLKEAYPNYFADSTRFIEHVGVSNHAYGQVALAPGFAKLAAKASRILGND